MAFEGIGFVSSFDRPSLQWHQRGRDRLISAPSPQTRILVVDDSALMRCTLRTCWTHMATGKYVMKRPMVGKRFYKDLDCIPDEWQLLAET